MTPDEWKAYAYAHKCDCQAWKTADLSYQSFSTQRRRAWNDANRQPHTSAYDHFMRYAIPHLLRGLPADHGRYTSAIRKLKALAPAPYPALFADPGPNWTLPPVCCQLWGLNTVQVAFYKGTDLPGGPDMPIVYRARIFAQAYLHYAPTGKGYFRTRTTSIPTIEKPDGYDVWTEVGQTRWGGQDLDDPPTWTALNYCPPKQYLITGGLKEQAPDEDRKIVIGALSPAAAWHSWPQIYPSLKATTTPPAAPDFPPTIDDGYRLWTRL